MSEEIVEYYSFGSDGDEDPGLDPTLNGRMEPMPSTSKWGVSYTFRAVPVSDTQVQSTSSSFEVLSDTELCGFCREPAILSKDSDNDSKLFKTLRNHLKPTKNQNDCKFKGDIHPFCPPCKELATQLWECDELIKKTLAKAERIKIKFEKRLIDDILSFPEFQSTTQLQLPEKQKRLVQLKKIIFENHGKRLRVEKLQKLSSRSNTKEWTASANTLVSCVNDWPDKYTSGQPKLGRDTSAMNGTGASGSHESASATDNKKYSSGKVTFKKNIPLTSKRGTQAAAIGDGESFEKLRGGANFTCNFCARSFSDKQSIMNHLPTHTREKPYDCKICGDEFSLQSTLSDHIRTHNGERPFKCAVCKKTYTQKSNLRRHLRTHTGEKPFQCIVCGMRCGDRSNLTKHMRIHTGERPFKCEVCCERFLAVKGNL